MSGMKRRGQPAGSNSSLTQPTIQMYNPNQYSNVQTPWRNQELQPPNENSWYNTQTPQTQPLYNQSLYAQPHQPQHSNYWQQQPYADQINTTPNYNQPCPPNTQVHDYYNNQQSSVYNYDMASHHAQDPQVPQTQGDPWNWGWGDEDNSNSQNIRSAPILESSNNVSGNVEPETSWSFSQGDLNINLKSNSPSTQSFTSNVDNSHPLFTKMGKLQEKSQLSVDSQLSQDSSDFLHTSESDKSHVLSRSSTVSESPVSGFHHVETSVGPDNDMNTSSSSNSLQHENREVLSNYLELHPAVINQSPPAVRTPPLKNQTPPLKNQTPPIIPPAPFGTDISNPYKRNNTFSKPHKTDFYSNNYVNLETMPDNSEHPDVVSFINKPNKISPIHMKPENNEIASINDRNQYLETGQLESLPAIGSRLVVGQQLQHNDEPPPGLSRMVLGQTEVSEPPVGLHRMVPGESSSPETYQAVDVSIRSATIGADTSPPTIVNSSGAYNIRETNADGANNLDDDLSPNLVSTRRDLINGQPQSDIITKLASSVRDLAIGENVTDTVGSTIVSDRITRGSSRQDSSDSESQEEREKIMKENKDRRYKHSHDQYERQKTRSRYSPSPERYRDKKYERERRRYKNKRYGDDTDYLSDKEKDRQRGDRRHEDYDRKYSSLKRDEKARGRRDPRDRDYGRDPRRTDYYSRYEEDFEDSHRSRPTSRSDSMQESYRQDQDRHRIRDHHRRHREREPFNPYMQGYPYDPYNTYYHQYQYYENLRRTNPQAYMEWYRKYYQQANVAQQSYGTDDRASVHSGRSSANEELAKERYMHQSYYNQSALNYYREPQTPSISGHYGADDSSVRAFDQTDSTSYLEETTVSRLTPAKFATPHVNASLVSGHLVKVFPHYPLDGQTATVEIANLHDMLSKNEDYKELSEYPGPLVKGITHKKTIIEYCENKIRNAICNRELTDVESYILMWELLILLLRQNGMVVGTDIAELLMKDRKQGYQGSIRRDSVTSQSSSLAGDPSTADINNIHTSENSAGISIIKEEAVTNKFRNYLIYGSEKEALECAMKHGLWGHALFLASKLDKRTYANVMTRFANGLNMNDPLQTLYQLLSGKVPSAVTCVVDEKWGDWRPHLAMILSNTTQRPELDQKAITTLGDTLFSRGSLFAAQFCYLMVQVGFSRYGSLDAKLVLLGSNHNKSFMQFATNEAVIMTEIYEYACSLNNDTFLIPEFLPYKYLLSTRLADYGLLEKSLAYLEKIALPIIQNPRIALPSLVTQTCELADHLQYNDPIEEHEIGWLQNLKAIDRDFNLGLIKHESVENILSDNFDQDTAITHNQYESSQNNPEPWQSQHQQQTWHPQQYTEHQPQDHLEYNQLQHNSVPDGYRDAPLQEQEEYWSNQQQWSGEYARNQQENIHQGNSHPPPNDFWSTARTQDTSSHPQITMPNQSKGGTISQTEVLNTAPQPNLVKPKVQLEKPTSNSGWFGGIFSKLSLRPKNQMKLPDDKNPTIVWDESNKRWINKDAEGDDVVAELKPPPKISDMIPNKAVPMTNPIQTAGQYHNNNNVNQATEPTNVSNMNVYNNTFNNQQPVNEPLITQPTSNQPNMFKLQRGRNLKKSYVDVFNPSGNTSNSSAIPPTDSFTTAQNNFKYFVPAPVNDPNAPTDFLTPISMPHQELNSQMSRWSSASSLSKEVQYYTQRKPPIHH